MESGTPTLEQLCGHVAPSDAAVLPDTQMMPLGPPLPLLRDPDEDARAASELALAAFLVLGWVLVAGFMTMPAAGDATAVAVVDARAPSSLAAWAPPRAPELVAASVSPARALPEIVTAPVLVHRAAVDEPAAPEPVVLAMLSRPMAQAAVHAAQAPVAVPRTDEAPQAQPTPPGDRIAKRRAARRPAAVTGYDGHMRAGSRLARRSPRQALIHFEQAHAARPARAEPVGRMGWAYLEIGRAGAAEASFRRCVALSSHYGPCRYGLGVALGRAGKAAAARVELQRYVDRHPSGSYAPKARRSLARPAAGQPAADG